jgi:hypothetical protein
MVNLLYMAIFGKSDTKAVAFRVMTESRELSNYCQESVRPSHSRRYSEALQNLDRPEALQLLANAVIADNARRAIPDDSSHEDGAHSKDSPAYLKVMEVRLRMSGSCTPPAAWSPQPLRRLPGAPGAGPGCLPG